MDSRNPTVEVAKALSLLDSELAVLKAAGFQELVYEDFYDVLISLIRQIVVPEPNGTTLTKPVLLEAFQDAEGEFQLPSFLDSHLCLSVRLSLSRSQQLHRRVSPPLDVRDYPL